jgi:FKBP-type peptidyl-prolyl cis-trans isomerase
MKLITLALVGSLAVVVAGCGGNQPAEDAAPVVADGSALNTPMPESETASTDAEATDAAEAAPATDGKVVTTASGLKYEVLQEGSGEAAIGHRRVTVHYTGWLEDGKKFDSSHDHPGGRPFPFTLGHGDVIPGWDEGVSGMKVGEKRKLTIPSDLAYGDSGHPGGIPPKATLTFEVELLEIGEAHRH